MKCLPYLGRRLPAAQQPDWHDDNQATLVRNVLSATGPLVGVDQVLQLRRSLARVAAGQALVLQAGDCAEHPDECGHRHVTAKSAFLHELADLLSGHTGLPVLRVGRIAGQFTKPRSNPFDEVDGTVLPAYRGHMVNGPEFDPASRTADPLRMLMCFMAARETMQCLGWHDDGWVARGGPDRVWTSHEALLLDYEQPQVRRYGRQWLLGSTHWPWVGERTRQLDGAHLALLRRVVNPVGLKVGPGTTPAELLATCRLLDPRREPGRLTLIVRMGAEAIAERLPALVAAVRDDGHPVLWLSDPMHANTVKRPDGTKTRVLDTVVAEVRQFLTCLADAGVAGHGLHLEASPFAVDECVGGPPVAAPRPVTGLPSLCDPRLNPEQATEVVSAWSATRDPRPASVLTSAEQP